MGDTPDTGKINHFVVKPEQVLVPTTVKSNNQKIAKTAFFNMHCSVRFALDFTSAAYLNLVCILGHLDQNDNIKQRVH